MNTYRIYVQAVGREGTSGYSPRKDLGTIEGRNELDALDKVAERIGEPRLRRTRSIPVLGVGSLKVEAV